MMSNTEGQIEKVIIDAGLVYVNYGLESEKLIAPCRGENVFDVEQEIREIEINGLKGKTKGLRRKILENAKLTVNLMELSLDNLKIALPGSKLELKKLSNGWKINSSDYIDNIVLIGTTLDDKFIKITLNNVLVDDTFSLAMNEKDESVVTLSFSAHYDLLDSDSKLWSIEELDALV